MSAAAPWDDVSVRKALQDAMAHHQAGRLAEAETGYRALLAGAPHRPEPLVLLADLAQRRGSLDEALLLLERAVQMAPQAARFRHQLASALLAAGRVDDAIAALRRAVALDPGYADAWYNLGNALATRGRVDESIASYRRAIAADPGAAAARNNLGAALEQQGRLEEAFACYRAALEAADRPEFRLNLARCIPALPRLPADAGFAALLARAIDEAWARPGDLARSAIVVLKADPRLHAAIEASSRDASGTFDAALFADLSRHKLLIALLGKAQVCEAAVERFLTHARRAALEAAEAGTLGAEALPFLCALARQCYLDDYLFALAPGEEARAQRLAERIGGVRDGDPMDLALLAIVGAYLPLGGLANAAALLARDGPPAVRELLVQQVAEPAAEREDRARIPTLTPIRDAVSQDVRRQYEQNPYPRWVALPPIQPLAFETYLRALFPRAAFDAAAFPRGRPLDVLIAGCGTGQQSADLARQFPDMRILAIDLSLASLAYARRKSRELALGNVEYAQADIVELDALAREFDVVSSVGVLHHLADPMAGLRNVVARLRPGGFLQLGLYSEHGRRDLAAARQRIAERGDAPTPQGIRAAREALLAEPRFARVTGLRDFYGMNECRDLLFHVQEHRFTLPQVARMLAQCEVELVGLLVDGATRMRYAQRFPGDRAQRDLASWDAYEQEFPDTFAGMYLLWARKPAGA